MASTIQKTEQPAACLQFLIEIYKSSPAFQAAVGSRCQSANCATLVCGYENAVFQTISAARPERSYLHNRRSATCGKSTNNNNCLN